MRFVLLALVLLASSAGLADSARKPARLVVADASPLTIRGTSFGSRELVRVTVRTPDESVSKRVRAGVRGSFVATFATLASDRCSLVTVRAGGTSGRRAELKLLPAPACPPA